MKMTPCYVTELKKTGIELNPELGYYSKAKDNVLPHHQTEQAHIPLLLVKPWMTKKYLIEKPE